jgi:hypothetical protein
MRRVAQLISLAALAATILPPVLFFVDRMDLDLMKWWMLGAAIAWFASAPLWMNRR